MNIIVCSNYSFVSQWKINFVLLLSLTVFKSNRVRRVKISTYLVAKSLLLVII